MNKDAFELLREANPVPEDPPPLPITPLLERVDVEAGELDRGAKRRSRVRLALGALGPVVAVGAVAAFALTGSVVTPKKGLDPAKIVVAPEHETAQGPTPDEL